MSDWRPPEPPDTHIDEVRRRVAQQRIAELRVRLAEGSQPDDDEGGAG